MRTVRILLWLPLVAFLIVLGLVSSGLIAPKDRTVRSALIGQPLPAFNLPALQEGTPPLTAAILANGKPKLLNIFASWCVPCAAEAPQLLELKRAGITIIGVAIRDKPEDARGFLRTNGDPYASIARDDRSTLQVALGSSGVPSIT